jgi:hypothetical protein
LSSELLRMVYLKWGSSEQMAWLLIVCWCVETVYIFAHNRQKHRQLFFAFQAKELSLKSLIIVWANSGLPLSDLQHIQFRLLSLCETFSFAAVPTYRFTSTQLQQPLNSICSSQPTGHEAISWHEISVKSANLLRTDDCTTAGLTTERIVMWCSSVMIQQ